MRRPAVVRESRSGPVARSFRFMFLTVRAFSEIVNRDPACRTWERVGRTAACRTMRGGPVPVASFISTTPRDCRNGAHLSHDIDPRLPMFEAMARSQGPEVALRQCSEVFG